MLHKANFIHSATSRWQIAVEFAKVALISTIVIASIDSGAYLQRETSTKVALVASGGGNGSYTLSLYSINSASNPGNPGASTTYVSRSGQVLYPVMFPTVTLNSTLFSNPPCVAVFFEYFTSSEQAGYSRSVLPQLFLSMHRSYPYCIDKVVTTQTPPTNPAMNVNIVRYEITRSLPIPKPSFDPPFTLVSVPAFLSSGATLSDHLDLSTPIGRVIADATGTLDINFGDGTSDLSTNLLGGPYPTGNITHTWSNTGCYLVDVTVDWTVLYQTPNGTGQINGLTTDATIPNYCVYSTTSQIYR